MSWFTDYQEKMENEWDQFQMIMDDLREWHLYGDLDEDDFREKVEDNTEVLGQVVGELVFETLEEHNFGLPAAGPPPEDGVRTGDGGEWRVTAVEPVDRLGHDHDYLHMSCNCGTKGWYDRHSPLGHIRLHLAVFSHAIRSGHDPTYTTVGAKPSDQ